MEVCFFVFVLFINIIDIFSIFWYIVVYIFIDMIWIGVMSIGWIGIFIDILKREFYIIYILLI